MTTHPSLTPDEIERLMAELDAGVHDEDLAATLRGTLEAAPAHVPKFSELTPFDVKAWAERKGIKLPKA